jgi:endoglucanase
MCLRTLDINRLLPSEIFKMNFGIGFALCVFVMSANVALGRVLYTGVNQAGMEFGDGGAQCVPTQMSINYFTAMGHNIFRIPFKWEYLQPCAGCPLDAAYLAALDEAVNRVTKANPSNVAIVDCHNYFKYNGALLTSSQNDLPNLWSPLAAHYKGNQKVFFGIMNEPVDSTTEEVFAVFQPTINAIRASGAANLILVSGNGWDGLMDFVLNPWYGTPNTYLAGLTDPLDNYVFEMHQYFDWDYAGHSPECNQFPFDRIQAVAPWLRSVGKKAIVTEIGLGNNQDCTENHGRPLLDHLSENSDVYLGWLSWSAGACWFGGNILSIDPANVPSSDIRVQLLSEYAARGTSGPAPVPLPVPPPVAPPVASPTPVTKVPSTAPVVAPTSASPVATFLPTLRTAVPTATTMMSLPTTAPLLRPPNQKGPRASPTPHPSAAPSVVNATAAPSARLLLLPNVPSTTPTVAPATGLRSTNSTATSGSRQLISRTKCISVLMLITLVMTLTLPF